MLSPRFQSWLGAALLAAALAACSSAPKETYVERPVEQLYNEGVDALVAEIDAHRRADTPSRRSARARAQILSMSQSLLRGHPQLATLADAVAGGGCDPYTAAESLIRTPDGPTV